jgi:hypothetical protein
MTRIRNLLLFTAPILAALALGMVISTRGEPASAGGAPGVASLTTGTAGTTTAVRTSTVVRTVTVTPQAGQGCTPGFWKTHTDTDKYPNAWPPTSLTPGQRVDSVFTIPGEFSALADDSLLDALQYGGGDSDEEAAQILLRAAVAAVLNAAHPNINYPGSVAGIVADVNGALASSDRDTMLDLAGLLDRDNNRGCPINGSRHGAGATTPTLNAIVAVVGRGLLLPLPRTPRTPCAAACHLRSMPPGYAARSAPAAAGSRPSARTRRRLASMSSISGAVAELRERSRLRRRAPGTRVSRYSGWRSL